MAFWSGDKLSSNLKDFIQPFNPKNIDCASYRLSVGDQAYVTLNRPENVNDIGISHLDENKNRYIKIPPGQFAFLLTEECVSVPTYAIALISMRAKYKFKGLINVSGFHVDPGWYGKLIFSVYNAGPIEVILERGEAAFLIVYADLDRPSAGKFTYTGDSRAQSRIPKDYIERLKSDIFSQQKLINNLEDIDQRVKNLEKTDNSNKSNTILLGIIVALLALVVAIVPIAISFFPKYSASLISTLLDDAGYKIEKK